MYGATIAVTKKESLWEKEKIIEKFEKKCVGENERWSRDEIGRKVSCSNTLQLLVHYLGSTW